jgi:hypothetical protein
MNKMRTAKPRTRRAVRRDRRTTPKGRPPARRRSTATAAAPPLGELFRTFAAIADLKPHPQNYRTHTDDQLAHLVQSIREHGLYRNVVVARDGTILAGHGVVLAAQQLQLTEVPIVRLDVAADDPRALQLLVGDNQIGGLARIDDAQLLDLLTTVTDSDLTTLLGTGYDAASLAALTPLTSAVEFTAGANTTPPPTDHTCPKCGHHWSEKAGATRPRRGKGRT